MLMKPILEKREWPRHQVAIPISLKYSDPRTSCRTWHAGEARNVSVDGMMIVSSGLKEIQLSSTVDILCFPQNQDLYSNIKAPEPVSMTGVVIWQNTGNGTAGIRLNT